LYRQVINAVSYLKIE